ncbi:hypothetical protein ABZ249_30230 [Nocardiopsis sp. NPDC006139]|uniref:hypothetical protein n=1 Tax=Nocardiopsis sp. NPDC006139 TaxID=3154578 RepID=UPI0033AEB732
MTMTADKPRIHPEPVDFNDVNIGDELEFSNRDNGFGGTGGRIDRTGIVTAKTAKTVTVETTGNNPLAVPTFTLNSRGRGKEVTYGRTARLRAADWYDRSVRRVEKAARTPYDADHVHIIDDGNTLTAIWIADPEKAKNPRATYNAPLTYESQDDYETVAEATRYYKTRGATFSGWIVRDATGNHSTVPIPTKAKAMQALKQVVAEYFNRGR